MIFTNPTFATQFFLTTNSVKMSFNCVITSPQNFMVANLNYSEKNSTKDLIVSSIHTVVSSNIGLLNTLLPSWALSMMMGFLQNRALLDLMTKLDISFGTFFDFLSNFDAQLIISSDLSSENSFRNKFLRIQCKSVRIQILSIEEIMFISTFLVRFIFLKLRHYKKVLLSPKRISFRSTNTKMYHMFYEWFQNFSEYVVFAFLPLNYEFVVLFESLRPSFKMLFFLKNYIVLLVTSSLIIRYCTHISFEGQPQSPLVIFPKRKY